MKESNLVKSSRKRRIAAFLIDYFLMSFLVTSFIVVLIYLLFEDDLSKGDKSAKFLLTTLIVIAIGFLIYFAKDSCKGMSVGKWIMRIMVRDVNNPEQIPHFGRLFLRNVFIVIWPIEFVVLALSDQKRRLGDIAAKTIVVRNTDDSNKNFRIVALISIGLLFSIFLFFIIVGSMKKSDAYKTAVVEIENNQQLKNEIGEITDYGMFPTGSINYVDGYGEAELEIKVIGTKSTKSVYVYLIKEVDKEWQLVEMIDEDDVVLETLSD